MTSPEELGEDAREVHLKLQKFVGLLASEGTDSEAIALALQALGIGIALGRLGVDGTIHLVRQWGEALDLPDPPPTQHH
jgi:hypothetical protein